MAGITDLPFRDVVCGFGAGLVVSEMVASQEMVQARPSTRARAELGLGRDHTSVQIAGRDPKWMAECARMVADKGARLIDINMGCPSKQVTNGASGSALMREPDHALRLIEAVVGAVSVPVTVKMRLGWDDNSLNAPDIARRAVDSGVSAITVHGRTRCQFYKGRANWRAVRDTVRAVPVPVFVNGDITSIETARLALDQSGAAGVMIGRGIQGRPWLIAQVAAAMDGKDVPQAPDIAERIALIKRHYLAILSFYGTPLGIKIARKHLGWYLDDISGAQHVRANVFRLSSPEAVIDALDGLETAVPVCAVA